MKQPPGVGLEAARLAGGQPIGLAGVAARRAALGDAEGPIARDLDMEGERFATGRPFEEGGYRPADVEAARRASVEPQQSLGARSQWRSTRAPAHSLGTVSVILNQ